MTDERFRKYLAFRSLEQIGGADTRELADDLAQEWDGAAYVRIDVVDAESAALREQLAARTIELEREGREMQKWNNRANQLAVEGQNLQSQLAQLTSERDALLRGEFICQRCHLRKDAEFESEVNF